MFLLLASIFFYAWGEIRYLPIIFATICISYIGALIIERFERKKLWLWVFVLLDLSMLLYFKYANFVLENLGHLFHQQWHLNVFLPLGISFYTFQALSYLVDVYRRQVKAQGNFLKVALYICLFPQLIAGPIIKYHDIADQIDYRKETISNIYYGIRRLIIGLAKKVLVANTLAVFADRAFEVPAMEISMEMAWLGAVAKALQVYYDFSGYSDMAIGLGALFGFKFMENFDYPYISKSISEFWRRWHISLSSWAKDYIYISLGGSRVKSEYRVYINLFLTMLAIGVWHGAAWTYIVWGAYFAVFSCIERYFAISKRNFSLWGKIIGNIYCLLVCLFAFVLSSSQTITQAFEYVKNMFGLCEHVNVPLGPVYYLNRVTLGILVIAVLCSMPIFKNMLHWGKKYAVIEVLVDVWLLVLLVLSCAQLAASTYNPFIYFRF